MKEGRAKDKVVFNQIVEIARVRSSQLAIIRLSCSTDEITRRIVNSDRRERHKSTDSQAAKLRNESQKVFEPEQPNVLNLDVTELSARAAAETIINYIESLD